MKLTTLQKWRRTLPANLPGLRAYIATVKSLFRYAYNQGYIESNIARCLKVPKITPIRVERNMSKEQALSSIEACSGNDKLLLTLLFYLGARISEAIQIKRQDIKDNSEQLRIRLRGKGGKVRVVSLNNRVSSYVRHQLPKYATYIFPGKNGHLTRQAAGKRVKKAVRSVLPKASCHWFRHCMANECLLAGVDLATLSKTLGHSSISTTGIYLHGNSKGVSSLL